MPLLDTHSREEVRAKAANVDASMKEFEKIVLSRMAFDPSAIGSAVNAALAPDAPNAGESASILAANLSDTAPYIGPSVQRRATISAAQATKETDFATKFMAFYARWSLFYKRIQGFDLFGPSPDAAWKIVTDYETNLGTYKQEAAQIMAASAATPGPVFGPPINPTPVVPGQPALPGQPATPALPGAGPALSSGIPSWLLIGGVAVGGVLLAHYLTKSKGPTSGQSLPSASFASYRGR
jgi:hypothetical protein